MSIVVINHHGIIKKYGYNNRHYKLGKSLSEKGINFELISSSLRQSNQKYIHNETIKLDNVNEKFKFISLKTLPKYNNNILRLINYLDFTFKVTQIEFSNPPKHIIGSSIHPFTWIAAYKLAKKYNSKFHIEIRDIWPLSLHEDLGGLKRKFIFKVFNFLEKKYYPLADSIIVTAPKADKYLNEQYKIDKSKVFYIPHSINVTTFENDIVNHPYSIIDNIFNGYFNITYTGALSSSEGLTNLLELAKELKDYKNVMIHIFGDGTEKEKLKKIIHTQSLNNIKMHGYVKGDYVPYILNKSNLLWVGLKKRKAFEYGISKNKFYEYIASKKPIIFHSNVKYSPLNEVDNAYRIKLNESAKDITLKIMNGDIKKFNSIDFLKSNHSDEVIAEKFLNALNYYKAD